jgi:hypothetical protein
MNKRDEFNDFFKDLLHACATCAERDVLRNLKEELYQEWLKCEKEVKP